MPSPARSGRGSGLRRAVDSVVITRRGWGFLVTASVCFVAAPILSLPALLYVTGLMLALVLLSASFVFVGHSRVRIERSFSPQVVEPGQPSRATVRITNLSAFPCPEARWADDLPPGVRGEASGILPALAGSHHPQARATFSYVLQGAHRGRHPIGPLLVDVLDPFGLVYRRHSFGGAEPLTVLPKRVELRPIAPRGTSEDGATRPAPQHVGVGEDDVIARSYLPGDAMKRLHWKATAHRGMLMVRQEEQQVTPRATVLVDCDPSAQGTARDHHGRWEYSAGLEWCIVAAASISTHLVRAGYVVDLQSSGATVQRCICEGQDTLEDALVDLAVLEPEEHDDERRLMVEGAAFVVLGRATTQRARHWATQLSGTRTVLGLVDASSPTEALDVLDHARWRVVTYHRGDDVAGIWAGLDGSRAYVGG